MLVGGRWRPSWCRGGWWGGFLRVVVVAGCVCVVAVVLGGVADGRSGGVRGVGGGLSRARASAVLEGVSGRASLARSSRLAAAGFARRRRLLGSSVMRAQRAVSQMAFHGLAAGAAERLLVRDFGRVVAGVSANPAASVARAGRVVRYLGDYRAVVRGADGLRVESSTTPLRVGVGGAERPVDLGLRAGSAGFAPVASLAGLSIARDSAGGVAVGSSGLRVMLEGAGVSGRMVGGRSVFFPDVGVDMDASVAPTINGAEFFAVLRSRLSPEQIRYRLVLPAGASLDASAGGAVVSRAGQTLARVLPPSAWDAQGSVVAVSMRVVGDELLLSVAHRLPDVAYPVLVDPSVTVPITETSDGWSFAAPGTEEYIKWSHEGFSIAVTPTTFPLYTGFSYIDGGEAAWIHDVPAGMELASVEFLGVSGYVASENEHAEPAGGTYWRLQACNQATNSFSAPPSTVTLHYELHPCEGAPWVTISLSVSKGLEPESAHVTDSGRISVGSILMTFTPSPQEEEEVESEGYGEANAATPYHGRCLLGEPVNCATGNQVVSQTDLSVGGRGPGLNLTRTYNSRRAAIQAHMKFPTPGPFGYGWTGTDSAHLVRSTPCWFKPYYLGWVCGQPIAVVYEDNGASVGFVENEASFKAESPLVQATLVKEGSDYIYTLPDQTKLTFNSSGQLLARTDRTGNAITVNRSSEGTIESLGDAEGRKLTFAYNSEKEVESVTDPMGHTVKYGYEGGNLVSVTEAGESSPRWRFKYNTAHELTEMTDGRGNTVMSEYEDGRVIRQKDPLGRERKWKYGGTELKPETTITEPNGAVTIEKFNALDLPTSVTHASGTSSEASTTYEYDGSYNLVAVTDPNEHKTKYGYDAAGDRTSETNPLAQKTEWEYNSTHDVISMTMPDGEKTTIKRNAAGEPESISRPAPHETTQTTDYAYDSHGDLESVTDALGRTTKYEYDSYGDRTAEIDPEGDKRSWGYNEDSQATSMVSPRGNLKGAEPAQYTTTIERDAQGRPVAVSEPGAMGTGKPTDETPAMISGVAEEHQTLTASPGLWGGAPTVSYAYQWRRCNSAGAECASITAATSASYTPAEADLGHTLLVSVTATNGEGSASISSTPTSEVAPLGSPFYLGSFGSNGSGAGQFKEPGDVVLDSKGNLWVLDYRNDRIEEFNEKEEFEKAFGSEGTGNGQLKLPTALAVDSKDDIWVVDAGNDRVEEFNEKGEYLKQFGSGGSGDGQFSTPEGIAVDSHGNVWVSDTFNARIQEFNEKGEFLQIVGTKGSSAERLGEPQDIAIGPGNNVWVADWSNNRVEEFNEKGEYVREFGSEGTGNGQFKHPYGIAVSSNGEVFVADTHNDRVQEFSENGEYITQFGTEGTGPGQFSFVYPIGLAANTQGEIWVTDSTDNRVEKWKPASMPSNDAPPSISGELLSGQTLGASTGTWTGVPVAYAYQWRRCNTAGEDCSNISGATSATYVLSHSDFATTLRVIVKATNSAGSSESVSAASEVLARPRTTEYAYDANGNPESVTDANGATTRYTYDADNEPTKVEEPNGTITETSYDSEGRVKSQTDGNKHTTEYIRNPLERVVEIIDPLKRKTVEEYDKAGNLVKVIDPAKRTTTNTYNEANELTETSYSDGKTPTVKYEYNSDRDLTHMSDGTGETTYTYDQLDRLTETQNGHKEKVGYEYNLDNEPTKITYPNGKSITRAYDKDGRLEKITDWLENTTKFTYDADSNLTATVFPAGTSNEDTYTYNEADQITEIKMTKGSETLASLAYTRENEGQVQTTTTKGLPGEESTSDEYDPNNRLVKAATTNYEYDDADNPTKQGTSSYTYDNADELETGPNTKYSYNENGQRTKTTPTTGPTTSYSYDQAGNLTAIERPKEGTTPAIEDTYTYNGEKLRTSQTISGTTSYLTWDTAEELPSILSNGSYNFIYGPDDLPIEQINNTTGEVLYLHHDQQGSTRLLTGSTGKAEGAYTYTPYGAVQEHTGTATTPLGYDGQYTSADTGLIYLRNRVYDPATAQFLSVDPLEKLTGAPYTYAGDNPVNEADPTGLCNANPFSGSFWTKGNCLSEHPGQAVEGAAVGVCVVASAGLCLGATATAYLFNTEQNIVKPCGFSLGEQAVTTATAGIGALPGLDLAVPQLLGWTGEAPVGVNAFLAAPGAVITALEEDIKRELLGRR
jgi:RHS repeat-associated protein